MNQEYEVIFNEWSEQETEQKQTEWKDGEGNIIVAWNPNIGYVGWRGSKEAQTQWPPNDKMNNKITSKINGK